MKKNINKIIALTLILSTLVIAKPAPAHADTWGASMMAAIWKQTTEQMVKSIQDTLVANLKIAAIRIVQAKLMSLLGGTGGSTTPGVAGYIISDWKMFIYSSASNYSTQMTNSFFSTLNSGATSAMRQYVISPAQKAVSSDSQIQVPNLQNYVAGGDPSKIFSNGSSNPWMGWRVAAQPQNDLAFQYLQAKSVQQAAYDQEATAKQAEGVAGQGLKGKETTKANQSPARQATASNGRQVSVPAGSDYKGQNITTPGSMIGNLVNEVNMIPMRMLSFAQTIPQVVTGMVSQMISQVIQNGVTNMISGGSSSSNSNMSQQFNSQMQSLVQNGVRTMASPNMFFGR